MKTNFKLLTVALLLSFTACKKDNDNTPKPSSPTTKDLLTERNWQMQSLNINPAVETEIGPISDLFALLPGCAKDDMMRLEKDGSFKGNDNGTTCDEGEPEVTNNGTWTLSSDNKKLTMTSDGDSQLYTIESISSDELKLSYQEVEDGTTYTLSTSFHRK